MSLQRPHFLLSYLKTKMINIKTWRNSGTEMTEEGNNDGGRVEQRYWNSGTEMVKQTNRDGGTVAK